MATPSKSRFNELMLTMDERKGCRSLLCDSKGIIIAEMVYRCMACFSIHDYIGDVSKHYHTVHLNKPNEDIEDATNEEDQDRLNNNTISISENFNNHNNNNTNNNNASKINVNTISSSHQSVYSNNCDESSEVDEKFNDKLKPNSHSITSFVKLNNSSYPSSSESCTRSGYIHCPVCSTIRCYTTLQRRYGQFTCVACYRFLKDFFLKPTRFSCPFLGQCPLDVKAKCKACWILACIKIYSVDSRRKSILEAHAPIKLNLPKVPSNLPSSSSSLYHYSNENCKPVKSNHNLKFDKSQPFILPNIKDSCIDENERSPEPNNPVVKQEMQPYHNILTCDEEVPLDCDEIMDDSETANNLQSIFKEAKPITTIFSGFNAQTHKVTNFLTAKPIASEKMTPIEVNNNNNNGTNKKSDRRSKVRVKNWCCLKCANCLADDCGKCINCLDRPKFGGPFVRKQRCVNKKCLEKIQPDPK